MGKGGLVKFIIFSVLNIIFLTMLITAIVGFLRPEAVVQENGAPGDSTAVADSSALPVQTQPPAAEENVLDSLQFVVSKMQDENKQLQQQLQKQQSAQNKQAQVKTGNVKQMAKIYENMDPQNAATILTSISSEMAVSIINSMKGRQAARVLSAMDPNKAAELSKKLLENR